MDEQKEEKVDRGRDGPYRAGGKDKEAEERKGQRESRAEREKEQGEKWHGKERGREGTGEGGESTERRSR